MGIAESVLKILEVGLSLWLSKEKTKYIDRLMYLKKRYYSEWNKPENERSDSELDEIRFEIKVLADAFILNAGQPNKEQ